MNIVAIIAFMISRTRHSPNYVEDLSREHRIVQLARAPGAGLQVIQGRPVRNRYEARFRRKRTGGALCTQQAFTQKMVQELVIVVTLKQKLITPLLVCRALLHLADEPSLLLR